MVYADAADGGCKLACRCPGSHAQRPRHAFDLEPAAVCAEASWRANPEAKLTAEQVRAIRERYVPRLVTMKNLADEHGLTPTTIFYAVHQVTWSSTGRLAG